MEKNTLARLVTPYSASEAVFISCSRDTTSGRRAAIWRYSLVKSTVVHSRLPGSLWVLRRTHWWVHPLLVINRSPLFLVLPSALLAFSSGDPTPRSLRLPSTWRVAPSGSPSSAHTPLQFTASKRTLNLIAVAGQRLLELLPKLPLTRCSSPGNRLVGDPALKSHFGLLPETPSRISGPGLGSLWTGFWVWHLHVRSLEVRGSREQNPRVRGTALCRGRSYTLMELPGGFRQSHAETRSAAGSSAWPCLQARSLRIYTASPGSVTGCKTPLGRGLDLGPGTTLSVHVPWSWTGAFKPTPLHPLRRICISIHMCPCSMDTLFFTFYLFFNLKHRSFTMLCWVSSVQQSDSVIHNWIYIYIYIFFFRWFSIIAYHKILSIIPSRSLLFTYLKIFFNIYFYLFIWLLSLLSHSVMSDSLRPHRL